MAVIAHVVLPGVTKEQSGRVRAIANWLDEPPDGGGGHLTWWGGGDCHNVDAWDSEGAVEAFGENLRCPALAQAGGESSR